MPGKKNTQQMNNQRSRGQSLIEFALVLPILLVLIISAIEIGRLFFTKIVITNAAREAAYYYAVNPFSYNTETLEEQASLAAIAEAANSGVTINEPIFSPTGSGTFSKIAVTVSATVEDLLILSFLGNVFSISGAYQDITLSSTVEMMIQ